MFLGHFMKPYFKDKVTGVASMSVCVVGSACALLLTAQGAPGQFTALRHDLAGMISRCAKLTQIQESVGRGRKLISGWLVWTGRWGILNEPLAHKQLAVRPVSSY